MLALLYRQSYVSPGTSSGGGGGGGGLPAGVTLVPIDGGPTYYADNSFTNAANAGYDSTMFPFIGWDPGIAGILYVKTWVMAGLNAIVGISSTEDPNTLTYMGPAGIANGVPSPGLYFLQGLETDNAFNSQLAAAGAETVGFLAVDEAGYWNSAVFSALGSKDITQNIAGTNTGLSATIPANFQRHRFCYPNWQHQFTDNTWDTYFPHFPALPGGVNAGLSQGIMTPAEMIYTTVTDRDGLPRRSEVTSIDMYWYGTAFNAADGVAGGAAAVFGNSIWNYNVSGSAPGSFAATTPQTINFVPTGGFYGPNIDSGATRNRQATITLNNGASQMEGLVTAYTPGVSMTVNIIQIDFGGTSTPASGWGPTQISLSPDQSFRGCHYGDQLDMQRGYQSGNPSIPIFSICESPDAGWLAGFGVQANAVQMKAAAWCSIIHGARGIVWFQGNSFVSTTYQAPIGTDTISIFDQAKALAYLVQALTPVILSSFAEGTLASGYVHVTGDNVGGSTAGSRAPWRPTDHSVAANKAGPYPYGGTANRSTPGCPNFNFNNSFASAFEVMAKWYTGATQTINGVTLTQNQFWLFSDYRGSADDGSLGANANTLNATFTLNNANGANAPTVTRIYSDAVLGAATNGSTGTRIKCGDTSQIIVGDTVTIAGTSGFTIATLSPNTSFTVTAVPDATHFEVFGAFGGALTFPTLQSNPGPNPGVSGAGTIIAFHTITVTGGTTFTDEFKRGSDIRIYRVDQGSTSDPWALLDGRANAPAGVSAQFPTILNQIPTTAPPNARVRWPTTTNGPQPPWQVAGVDYGVGYPAGQVFKDPTVDNLAVTIISGTATVTLSNPDFWVRIAGGGSGDIITFDGWDFSTHGGYMIEVANNFVGTLNIKNCNFKIGSNARGMVHVSLATMTAMNVTYSVFDSNAKQGFVDAGGGTTVEIGCNLPVQGANVTVEYCLFDKWDGRAILALGTVGTENFTFMFNAYSVANNYGGTGPFYPSNSNGMHQHCDFTQLLGGCSSIKCWFNTGYQSTPDTTTGFPGSQASIVHSDGSASFTTNNIDYEYNTWTGVGDGVTGPFHAGETNSTTAGTNSNKQVTSIVSFTNLAGDFAGGTSDIIGCRIYSSTGDIPAGTKVTAINLVTNSLTMDTNATGTNAAQHIFVWPQTTAGGTMFSATGTSAKHLINYTVSNNFLNIGTTGSGNGSTTLSTFPTTIAGSFIDNALATNNINMYDGTSLPTTP